MKLSGIFCIFIRVALSSSQKWRFLLDISSQKDSSLPISQSQSHLSLCTPTRALSGLTWRCSSCLVRSRIDTCEIPVTCEKNTLSSPPSFVFLLKKAHRYCRSRKYISRMAEIRDEYGNPIQLTDEHGNPVQLTDEHGNPMHLTGVAVTTVEVETPAATYEETTAATAEHGQPQLQKQEHEEVSRSASSSSSSVSYNLNTVGSGKK